MEHGKIKEIYFTFETQKNIQTWTMVDVFSCLFSCFFKGGRLSLNTFSCCFLGSIMFSGFSLYFLFYSWYH